MTIIFITSMLSGCSKTTNQPNGEASSAKKDIVKVWTFPVEKDYEQNFAKIKEDFESKNPNIEIQVEVLSWAEGVKKFDTAINAGDPPDLMFIVPSAKYVQTGLAVPIEDYIDKENLLKEIFNKHRVGDSELFALDYDLVRQLLLSFEGKVVYPKDINKEKEFDILSKAREQGAMFSFYKKGINNGEEIVL